MVGAEVGVGGQGVGRRPEERNPPLRVAETNARSFDGLTGKQRLDIAPLSAAATGGARVAAADVNGDGLADIVAASGPGDAPLVRSFVGNTGSAGSNPAAFDPAFRGGVFVGG